MLITLLRPYISNDAGGSTLTDGVGNVEEPRDRPALGAVPAAHTALVLQRVRVDAPVARHPLHDTGPN